MKKIANIVTSGIYNNKGLFNVVKSIDGGIIGCPTLVIGTDNAKECYKNRFNIVEWKVDEMNYWTFGSREKRIKNEEDINKFEKIAINKLLKSLDYKFVDILSMDKELKRKFFNFISGDSKKTAYINNNVLYVYKNDSNCVYGLLLSDIRYNGNKIKPLLDIIENNKNINFIKKEVNYSIINMFKNNKYVIPYLYSE